MKKTAIALGLIAASIGNSVLAAEGPVPTGIPQLDHVWVIMMENTAFKQIKNNPNAPFINNLAKTTTVANRYFAIAHPSLTNYLEVVGGSNFGVQSDNYPDWHNSSCVPNLVTGVANTDNPHTGVICPIAGSGIDAATPALDTSNEMVGLPGLNNIDGVMSIPAASNVIAKTIADQLVAAGRNWKSYQESLPAKGADNVNYADGFYTDKTDFSKITPVLNPALSQADVVALYAAKHAPFVYFKNIQDGTEPRNSLKNIVDFEGSTGLYADLATNHVPAFSFIAPNQCNDQHGKGNAGKFCNYNPSEDGTQAGMNPALTYRGDVTVQHIVQAIHNSAAWKSNGRNAIVVMWDENDYSAAPNINQVMVVVDTNYGVKAVPSNNFYTHYSLLKTLEAGFGLPCLNHACDFGVDVMSDMFRAAP